jgi:hypothetical protein
MDDRSAMTKVSFKSGPTSGARWLLAAALALVVGCGGSGSRRPDTGVGAGEAVPPTLNCADLCTRLGECFVLLCDEDTQSTRYQGADSVLDPQCEATCADATVQATFTSSQWTCLFHSSCRQVLDYDTCNAAGHYNCQ